MHRLASGPVRIDGVVTYRAAAPLAETKPTSLELVERKADVPPPRTSASAVTLPPIPGTAASPREHLRDAGAGHVSISVVPVPAGGWDVEVRSKQRKQGTQA